MQGSAGEDQVMRPRQYLPLQARELAQRQAGVLTTAQLRACGLTPRVIDRLSAQWQPVVKGIHLTSQPTGLSAVWAGVLRGGPDAVIGGLAACYLDGAVRDAPSTISVWVPERRMALTVDDWRVTFRRGAPSGVRFPPRTRIHDSLLDVAATHDEFDTVATITSAFARRTAEPSRLQTAMDERSRQRHRETIRLLCDPSSQGAHSLIEWLFLRDVVRAHGLPEPERQIPQAAGRVDALYTAFGTIVELDGMRDHSDWSKDMMRDNHHLLITDDRTLRYGLNAVGGRPCEVANQVAALLQRNGWQGQPRACRCCPHKR